MKIAVFAHACLLKVNRAIYQRFAEEGHQIRIIVPSDFGLPPEPSENSLEIISSPRKGKGQRFYYYPQAKQLLNEFSPDLVILDLEPDSLLAVQLARWCSRNKRKLIIQTCENLGVSETTQGKSPHVRFLQQILRNAFLAYTVPRVFHTWPISTSGANLLESFGFDRSRITRIPLGVNTNCFHPSTKDRNTVRDKWNVPPDIPVVAYIGRMVRQKGVDLLLESLSRLVHLPWKLAIDDFESKQNDPYLLQINNLLNRPVFQNRVIRIHAAHHEIPAVMNATDILVVPSIRIDGFMEQYGRVIPEALACGAFVIASDTGAFPEVGGNAVRYFKEGDIDELTTLLQETLSLSMAVRASNAESRVHLATSLLSLDAQWATIFPVLASITPPHA